MRVAVIGGGVSGLAAAGELAASGGARVTVYEKEERLGGGSARTVAVDDGGSARVTVYEKEERLGGGSARTVAVDDADGDGDAGRVDLDLGFMVFNPASSYPSMMEWLDGAGVEMRRSDGSFSVIAQVDDGGGRSEWVSGGGIAGPLARKKNAMAASFWRMLREILRFNKDALKYVEEHENNPELDRGETLGKFIQLHGYSKIFQQAYLIPICSSMWSSPLSQEVLGFSAFTVLFFCRHYNLLELFGRQDKLTLKGGWQCYIHKMKEALEKMGCQIKTSCPVKSVSSLERAGCRVLQEDGSEETYDRVIVAIHAPDALKVLGAAATHDELRILGAFQYVNSDMYLHCDKSLMPQSSSEWSATNFIGEASRGFSVTYWLNLLQNIKSVRPFLVTMNPPSVPDHVLLKWCRSQPLPSVAAAKASLHLDQIQGKRGMWFCGAYQGYGFHDGLKAGKATAQGLLGKKCDLLVNPKQMVPSWTKAGARLLVTKFLDGYISVGNLILLEEGCMFSFGESCSTCQVKTVMRVHDPLFYWKVATEADIGLADAYISGCFSFPDKKQGLLNLFLIGIANTDARRSCSSVARKGGWWTPMLVTARMASAKYFLRHVLRKNTVTQTHRNISQHYDLSNDFFSLFLDKSLTYSCGIFKTDEESLEEAQLRKLSLLIDKAKVERHHHVLDIGSGWGSLAIQVVKQTGCKYTGITLSQEQLKFAQRKVEEAGLQDYITFLLCDYRQIPPRKYDTIISCEMIEHVGHEYMEDFFACCESHLAEDGIFVLQAITMPEDRYKEYIRSPGFVKEYIFPGGSLPSLARITSAMSTSSRFCIEHLENFAHHYSKTLLCWRDNLIANKDEIMALGFDDKFIRVWEYYFTYCAAGFKTRTLGDYQIVFSRPGNKRLGCNLVE